MVDPAHHKEPITKLCGENKSTQCSAWVPADSSLQSGGKTQSLDFLKLSSAMKNDVGKSLHINLKLREVLRRFRRSNKLAQKEMTAILAVTRECLATLQTLLTITAEIHILPLILASLKSLLRKLDKKVYTALTLGSLSRFVVRQKSHFPDGRTKAFQEY